MTMWACTTLVLTFMGPFVDASNGFVATWAAMVCAIKLLLEEIEMANAAEADAIAAAQQGEDV